MGSRTQEIPRLLDSSIWDRVSNSGGFAQIAVS